MDKPVVVVGGGPAGSTAALCLRRLGREVVLLEREEFPRYRIGESLLPGTLSILHRLELMDRVKAADFPIKRAATFLWGNNHRPWSFTFNTPDTAPWVYGYSYQVTRAEYDKILLDAAVERGADVRIGVSVTGVDGGIDGEPAVVHWKNGSSSGSIEASYVFDASGSAGVIAKKLDVRKYDPYYKNLATWSYYKGGKRYKGDLDGNIFSVSFKDGWMWIIPLKDDTYSVGVVTGTEKAARMKEVGPEAFFEESVESCEFARDLLADAERTEDVRVVRDWAYSADEFARGKFFLCGDSGAFIDPLFSQGVHLATLSAMNAAAAVDHLLDNPDEADHVIDWYNGTYQEAYDRYHRFLSAFYANCNEEDSEFWDNRRLAAGGDHRFEGRDWYKGLAGQDSSNEEAIAMVQESADILTELWDHGSETLTDEFDETQLSLRRVRWFAEVVKLFRTMTTMKWTGDEVRLMPSFRVGRHDFKLAVEHYLGNAEGEFEAVQPTTEEHRAIFASLAENPMSYTELTKALRSIDGRQAAVRLVHRLVESGHLKGYDADGNQVRPPAPPRFGGVGHDDDLS